MLGGDLTPDSVRQQWTFQYSVGVDCSAVEPRCIWLAALRASPQAERTPVMSPLHGSRRLLRRHRMVKGAGDGCPLSNRNRRRPLSSGEVEGFSWRGPRTIVLQKNSQGFGFTLRHFIVYPPDSSLHSLKDKENGNPSGKACVHSRLEPVDTIFVKSVRENGPAYMAGLCTGDRLVKVNGESILGKTYSQVIALIQNSDSVLELSIVPKDQDVLQLACSQEAYLRRDHPLTREQNNLPRAQPLCDSCLRPHSTLDNCPCGPTCSPLNYSHPSQDPLPITNRTHSSSALRALDFHFNNHNAAIASATLPPPRKSSLPASARAEALCQQALSDWYYSQAQAAEHLSPRSRRVSQDRLAGLGLALGVFPGSAELHHTDSLQHHHHVATASFQDSYWLGDNRDVPDSRSRACSQNLLAAYAEYEHNYGRSVETLKQATVLVSPQCQYSQYKDSEPAAQSRVVPPKGGLGDQQVAEPQTPGETSEHGDSSYSPSFRRRSNLLSSSVSDGSISQRPLSSPVPSPAEEERPMPAKQEVILRRKPRANSSLAQQALDSLSSIPFIASMKNRRSSYLLAVTTERSKSCDEGLNIFKDEGRVLSKLPKRVKSFFLDGSLDSLRAQEEARNKRHSTSELGTTAVSNVRKEGWLHCKQVLSEKGKKLGSGIRPWKRVFSVLRSHSLFLYKDKREAVLHGAGAVSGQEEHSPISVRGCLVDIAYSETKRKHVLRLTTQDFCEYLLQAENREDMLSWIKAIRDNSKSDSEEIGFSRQALINKKLNDYRKHSLTGHRQDSSPKGHRILPPLLLAKTDNSAMTRASKSDDNKTPWGINLMKKNKKISSPKAFGVRLEDCQPAINHKFVPLIVEMCCAAVETMGLEYTGVYRVPGNNALVSSLQEHLNKGLDINTGDERWQDLNVISSLLKSFFRKLPEPLFTDDKYSAFIEANRIEDSDDRLQTMKKLIHDLPDYYYHTLSFLVGHLKKVADYSDKNKMEPRNLALVFGPTLVRTSEDNMTDMVTHMPDRYKIVETLILHCDWFFSDGQLDKEKAPDGDRDSPPVPNIDHLLCNIGRTGGPGDCPDSTIDSLKSKISLNPMKDLNAKEFLSAVTRKRKMSPNNHPHRSSSDENLEHEPVKSSNLRKEQKSDRDSTEVQKESPILTKGKVQEDDFNKNKDERESRVKFEQTDDGAQLIAHRQLRHTADVRRERRLLRPHSFHLLHPLHNAPVLHTHPSQTGLRGPVWTPRSRIPPGYTSSVYVPQPCNWAPAVPLRLKKSHTARSRAMSMTLELEDRARGWRTDKVEVIRVNESGVPQGSAIATMSCQQNPSVPLVNGGMCPWPDQSSSRSSVVFRRLPKSREQDRGWRRHTVMI